MVRLLIADSSALGVIGLRAVFSDITDVQIVGEARDLSTLEEALASEKIDVVLIDQTADSLGEKALQAIAAASKHTRAVCITHDPTSMAVRNAVRLGVRSYVKKDCCIEEVIDAVLKTGAGENFFCGQILEKLQSDKVDMEEVLGEPLSCEPISLSSREVEVVCMIVEGLSYTQIADRLCISSHTVTTHRRNVMSKIGVNNTAALVMYAVKAGLVSPNKFLFSAS